MTPASLTKHNLQIYKGCNWQHTLTFYHSDTNSPLDISASTFTLKVSNVRKPGALAVGEATKVGNGTGGKLTVRFSPAQTATLPVGQVSLVLHDEAKNVWLNGEVTVVSVPAVP